MFSFIRVAVATLSLHSSKTLTKTTIKDQSSPSNLLTMEDAFICQGGTASQRSKTTGQPRDTDEMISIDVFTPLCLVWLLHSSEQLMQEAW